MTVGGIGDRVPVAARSPSSFGRSHYEQQDQYAVANVYIDSSQQARETLR